MCRRHPVVPGRCVDLATKPGNDFPILEVSNQRSIIGVQQPCTTDQRERENVFVVGSADFPPTKFVRACLHIRIRHAPCPPKSDSDSEPLHESMISAQLPAQLAANNQLPTRTCQPIEKTLARRGPIIPEHLIRDVGIDNPAHQRPPERRISSMKNCP